ncbi:MAG: phosphoenolpyruvate synthase [Dehalococcoidales bacterium]
MSGKSIVWFKDVTKDDIPLVGGKGANLGEMTGANVPVPPGFIVTADAYFDFIDKSGLGVQIKRMLANLDTNDSRKLQQVSTEIEKTILAAEMPPALAVEINAAYARLGKGLVAVRSSATAEDLPEASFAGQQSTFLNIEGDEEVIAAVMKSWASLFEARAIYYRHQYGFDHVKVGIAVPVQRMVQSQTSGVIFTIEPVTSDPTKIIIEAILGLGEGLVSGEINPDLYIIDKKGRHIISRRISCQDKKLAIKPKRDAAEPNLWQKVPPESQRQQKISDADIIKLADLAEQLEEHYKSPQDVEWAKEGGHIYIVQTRPVTAVKETAEVQPDIKAPVLVTGVAASPGLASGPVKVLHDASEINRVLPGDILVTDMTTPDFVPAMKKAAAIVTNRGGRTAHAAIVSRELGIPAVVGTERATTLLKDKKVVTVDGSSGKVYSGKVARRIHTTSVISLAREAITTRTKVYVNLAQPELADHVAERNVDGVGLLRAEFMIARIGQHPRYMIDQGRGAEFTEKLFNGLCSFARAFDPRPVVYRTTDLKTNEYRELTGGHKYEEAEENPMIGYRGAYRYVADPEVFKLEIAAIKKCRQAHKNLWVMIPFVRTVDELRQTIKIMEGEDLKRSTDFKLWMMVEVPSNVFLLDKFAAAGLDGISIGSNDLTQLILGVDRDSGKLSKTFDERNEAVMMALEKVVKQSQKLGITSSICGQAPSDYPDITAKLVTWGITSVSVNPDVIGSTREVVARTEAKLKA